MLIENNVRKGFFERAEFEAVRALLPESIQAVITFAYLTGWRGPSEVLKLQWRQVDLVHGVVRLEPGTTKNRDARVFPFDVLPELRAILEEQRAVTDAVERATGQIIPWVFHRKGRPIRSYQQSWKVACEAAGCPGLVPHDFRRTAVRNMSQAGLPDTISMKLTGHKTRSVFDRYNVTSEADLRSAVARLAGAAKGTIQGTIDRKRTFTPIRAGVKIRKFAKESFGAGGGGRTHTQLPVRDFESRASASSATPARTVKYTLRRDYPKLRKVMTIARTTNSSGTPSIAASSVKSMPQVEQAELLDACAERSRRVGHWRTCPSAR